MSDKREIKVGNNIAYTILNDCIISTMYRSSSAIGLDLFYFETIVFNKDKSKILEMFENGNLNDAIDTHIGTVKDKIGDLLT